MTDEQQPQGPTLRGAISHYALWKGNLRKIEEVILDLQEELGIIFGADKDGNINAQKMREWSQMTNKIQRSIPTTLDTREAAFILIQAVRGALIQFNNTLLTIAEEYGQTPPEEPQEEAPPS